jgi:hypothetical protein
MRRQKTVERLGQSFHCRGSVGKTHVPFAGAGEYLRGNSYHATSLQVGLRSSSAFQAMALPLTCTQCKMPSK